jgi:SET domain-containing protein
MLFTYRNPSGIVFERALSVTLCEYPGCTTTLNVGAPYCAAHLQRVWGLRIDTSAIADAGLGVFACTRESDDAVVIPEGAVVCTYVGEVITLRELDKRYGDTTAPYALDVGMGMAIDAACHRGVGSMINHSSERPNTEFVVDVGDRAVDVVATRDIRNGEEILVNYGADYCFNDAQFATSATVTSDPFLHRSVAKTKTKTMV